jgi:hypothetical protein
MSDSGGFSTTVTNLVLRYHGFSRESVQQLKAALRQNTALESLVLDSIRLESADLAEIASPIWPCAIVC